MIPQSPANATRPAPGWGVGAMLSAAYTRDSRIVLTQSRAWVDSRLGDRDNTSMLNEIKLGNRPSAVERDAVDMLLACHQRIRNFTGIALRLADVDEAGTEEVANAAETVHRYYT